VSGSIDSKTILITGATSGIGFEAAVALAQQGARVAIVGRNARRTSAAVSEVHKRAGVDVTSHLCDFSVQADIRRLAHEVLQRHERIDVLVNNAGGVNKRRSLTVDGIERTFATNHLGYFLLTTLLLDRIRASAPARIITVASGGHRGGTMDLEDVGFERGYRIMRAYCRSKLANVLFANELAVRLAGSGVTSNSLMPGRIATNIWSGAPLWAKPLIYLGMRPWMLSSMQGAEPIVWLATDPSLAEVTGAYFERHRQSEPSPLARDAALGRKLWDLSEQLVSRSTHQGGHKLS